MPNMRKMSYEQEQIDRIDRALHQSKKFTDSKVYFETANGRELVSGAQLHAMRATAESNLLAAANE